MAPPFVVRSEYPTARAPSSVLAGRVFHCAARWPAYRGHRHGAHRGPRLPPSRAVSGAAGGGAPHPAVSAARAGRRAVRLAAAPDRGGGPRADGPELDDLLTRGDAGHGLGMRSVLLIIRLPESRNSSEARCSSKPRTRIGYSRP